MSKYSEKKARQIEAAQAEEQEQKRLDRQAAKAEAKAEQVDLTLELAIDAKLAEAREALCAVMEITKGLRQARKGDARAIIEYVRQKALRARCAATAAGFRMEEILGARASISRDKLGC